MDPMTIAALASLASTAVSAGKEFFSGNPSQQDQRSVLTPQQRKLHQQYGKSLQGPGAGGTFGDIADYYRNNLSDNPQDLEAFAAPEQRRFREDIIPGLAEQFAGMGAGGLTSSGFRNAAVGAGTDLSERLGALRAGLRQQSAQGLQNFSQGFFNPISENTQTQRTPGFLESAAPGITSSLLQHYNTPNQSNNMMNNQMKNPMPNPTSSQLPKFGSTPPYGQSPGSGKFNLPNFPTNLKG